MKKGVIYEKDTGKIVSSIFAPDNIIINNIGPDQEFLEVNYEIDINTNKVDTNNSIIVPLPNRTSPLHIYNYDTDSWEITLDMAKKRKWEDIKLIRKQKEFSTFIFNGNVYDCDELSRSRIQGAVQMALLDPNITIDWTLSDNTVINMTSSDIISMGVTLGNHTNNIFNISRSLRTSIDSAITVDQVEALSWPQD